jgi:hypothetical protein
MRSTKFWSTFSLGTVLALGATACNDGLTDVNINPNAPEDAPEPTLFVTAVRTSTRWLGNAAKRQFELLAQHLAEVQYPDTDTYTRLRGASTEGNFNAAYVTELRDLQVVIDKGRTSGEVGFWAPALVMKVWNVGVITDQYGDVPYTQALMGDVGGIAPAYDPQETIYPMMFAALDSAAQALNSAAGQSLGASDPIYAGNRAGWQRFANSLRARHALRIVNVNPTLANTQLTAAFNGPNGVITSNAQSARFPWPGNGTYNNPWQVDAQTRDDHRVSTRLMGLLTGMSDPRLTVFAQPTTTGGTYTGLENGLTHQQAVAQLNTTSKPGTPLYNAAQPEWFMTAAEVLFIQAEAAERGLGGLTSAAAQGYYEAGIRASMAQWGVTNTAAIDAYIARADVGYVMGETTNNLKKIATQKWIALYSDGIQAWSEWRRTCVPTTVRPGPSAIEPNVPRRLQYSPIEKTINGAAVDAAIAHQGADQFSTRMWWDKSPAAAPTYDASAQCGVRIAS